MPAFTPSPTVGQVVASLNRSTPPSSMAARLSGFHPLSSLLAILVVLLLGTFLVLSWHMVRHFEGLAVDIRDQRARIAAKAASPTISNELLVESTSFAQELASAPQRAALLHLQRARALLLRGRDQEAASDFFQTMRLNPRLVTVDDRLEWARVLARIGATDHARTLLHPIDGKTLDEPRRQRLSAILLELLVTSRLAPEAAPSDHGTTDQSDTPTPTNRIH